MNKEQIFAKYGRRFAIVESSSITLYEIIPDNTLQYVVIESINGQFRIEENYSYLEEVFSIVDSAISLNDDNNISLRLRTLFRGAKEFCSMKNDLTYNIDKALNDIEVEFYRVVRNFFPRSGVRRIPKSRY